jgi:KaiC/GvpD/RAD55 family RecA-like ATPase
MLKHKATVEEYQSEAVIMMYHDKKGEQRERSIEIFKMRGTNHSKKIYPLKITSQGIIVFPNQTVY